MAEVKISQLPFIGSSLLSDFSTSVQGGTTWQATNQQILSLIPTVPGLIIPLSKGGTGSNITAINNAVFSTDGSGVSQLSATLPAGLTIPGYATTGSLAAYLPLAGGALVGNVTNTARYLFQPTAFVTTMSQTGLLATITGLTSGFATSYVVPATGSAFTILAYQGTTTVPTNVFQTIAGGTSCTLYYYPNGTPLDIDTTFFGTPVSVLSRLRYAALGNLQGPTYGYLNVPNVSARTLSVTGLLPTAPFNSSNQSASQSGTTVTGVGTSWDSTYKGHMIRFATGSTAWITAVGSTTSLTVVPSQTVAATDFDIPGKTTSFETTSIDSLGNFGTNNLYVNNTFNLPGGTFSVGGNTSFSGAFTFTGTLTGNTNVTFPTSGTLLSDANTTHTVYVDANVGNDTTGTGSVLSPYATVTKAQSVITTASLTNTYAINLQGKTTESVTLKPWISIVGNGYLTCAITGNLSLDSTWGTVASPRANISNIGVTGNITFTISGVGTAPNIILSSCFISGTAAFTGRSGSDFYQCYNTEIAGAVTATDCLFQSYSNIYDSNVLYRNSAAPGSSFWQSSGDLFNGAFNVTAGTAQPITGFINNSRVSAGSTVTGATANITYDATAYSTGSITLVTSGTATPNLIPLRAGGTNANLTASNGGLLYSTGSALAILSGTATAGQIPLSGASSAPSWSTSTYPGTNAINTLLYASAANVMSALATANNGTLITSAGGVPSISSTLPSAVQNNITAVNSAANTLTIGGSLKTFTGTAANVAASGNVTPWTPGIAFGGGTTGIVYAFQSGFYDAMTMPNGTVKVTAWGSIGLSNKGSSTGNLTITGFPVNSGGNGTSYGAALQQQNISTVSGAQLWMSMSASNSTAVVQYMSNATAINNVTNAALANNSILIFTITYWTN